MISIVKINICILIGNIWYVGKGNDLKSIRELKFAILAYLSTVKKQHKINLLGRTNSEGHLEGFMNIKFDNEIRHRADFAFEELKNTDLICPTYSDIIEPENWVEITDKGRKCLENKTLDNLDKELLALDKNLLEIRDGAWAALEAKTDDSLRQAAHSARELITHVLQKAAPNEKVKLQPNFLKDNTSSSGLTRKQRAKLILEDRHGKSSKTELKVIDASIDLLLAINDDLQGAAHSTRQPIYAEIKKMLITTEMAIEKLLLPKN
ncbi:MAG: hypothetical protein AMJ53_04345 [Gammaproteobacteria bacterium SG8_11]|nr:MAG: hypothetical protein AMJ53_04345 [Gammaproteobacteria bacterium SG8_11]